MYLHKQGQKTKELQNAASAEAGAELYWILAIAWLLLSVGWEDWTQSFSKHEELSNLFQVASKLYRWAVYRFLVRRLRGASTRLAQTIAGTRVSGWVSGWVVGKVWRKRGGQEGEEENHNSLATYKYIYQQVVVISINREPSANLALPCRINVVCWGLASKQISKIYVAHEKWHLIYQNVERLQPHIILKEVVNENSRTFMLLF